MCESFFCLLITYHCTGRPPFFYSLKCFKLSEILSGKSDRNGSENKDKRNCVRIILTLQLV